MKKITRKQSKFLINRIKKEIQKSIWFAKKIKRLRLNRKRKKQQQGNKKKKTIAIFAPEIFNLNNAQSRNDLLIFLRNISNRLFCGDRVKISFDITNKVRL